MRIPYTHKKTSECGAGEEEEEGPITQYIQRETSKEKEKREEEKYMFRRWVCVCTCGEGGREGEDKSSLEPPYRVRVPALYTTCTLMYYIVSYIHTYHTLSYTS